MGIIRAIAYFKGVFSLVLQVLLASLLHAVLQSFNALVSSFVTDSLGRCVEYKRPILLGYAKKSGDDTFVFDCGFFIQVDK